MSEYCTECGDHENEWGKGPVMDELTDTISRLQALLKRARESVEDDIEDLRDDGHADCDDSCADYREWVGLSALLADIDAELRRGGEMTDPVARALACVDAEADKRAAEMEYDTSKGAVGSTAAIGIGQVHAKLVYRAHLERALRALWPFANWAAGPFSWALQKVGSGNANPSRTSREIFRSGWTASLRVCSTTIHWNSWRCLLRFQSSTL